MVGMDNSLVDWLADRLQAQGWSYRELARRVGVSHTTVAKVLGRQQEPTWDFSAAVAELFGLPPLQVFVTAGLLPQPLPPVAGEEEARAILRALPPDARAAALAMLRGLGGLPPGPPPPRVVGGEEPEAKTDELGVPLHQFRSLAERVARLSPEAQEQVMEALLQLVDPAAE